MREIKFRAWDTINRYICLPDDEFCISSTGKGAMMYDCIYGDHDYMEELELMQYTGLKDKNGVEIYEDDTVEVDTTGMNYNPEIIKGVVKYIDGCFTVEFIKPVYDNILKCMRERLYVKCFTVNHALKVTGNIYENPKLFK